MGWCRSGRKETPCAPARTCRQRPRHWPGPPAGGRAGATRTRAAPYKRPVREGSGAGSDWRGVRRRDHASAWGSFSWRSLVFRDSFCFVARHRWFSGIGRRLGGLYSHALEGRRLDHARQQRGEASVLLVEPLHNSVNGLRVIILHPPPHGIRQEFLGQAAVKILAMLRDEESLQRAEI